MHDTSRLDAALFASIDQTWTKVALVLERAAKRPSLNWRGDEDDLKVLAARLQQLVAEGSVVRRGDLNQWQFSEVRKPGLDLEEVLRDLRTLSAKGGGDDDGPRRA